MDEMKIRFSADLDYQADAVSAISDIFSGQDVTRSTFSVPTLGGQVGLFEDDLGVGNRLRLLDDEVLRNTQTIQLRNGLAPSGVLTGLDFTVEMETGTGKTYVYLRTIFELNRRYGFTKFIVVVPSIAIKEGTFKALQMTESHFRELYDNAPYDYFVYDSAKLNQVRNFAASSAIQIMVINIDAFRKAVEESGSSNIIHRRHDRLSGARPIDFIRSTNPIVIIDEPQSTVSTAKSAEAIAALNPLCTLRYSATHTDKLAMVYRLDSVDAYQRKLVKQIEVSSVTTDSMHNDAYVRLLSVDNKKPGPITAQLEIDVFARGAVSRKKIRVRGGSDLYELSGDRDLYEGYIVDDIYCEPGSEFISFTSNAHVVRLGQAIGDADPLEIKRLQIRSTIEAHLQKELALRPRGIKVLSLFFIDRVANYRTYDDEGNPMPGPYARIFEEEYDREIQKPVYDPLFGGPERDYDVAGLHDGYFAQDRRGGRIAWKDSRGEGKTAADESAYGLIMKDKERLLSLDEPLRFIWSHSALREGWDNPNVFQICTLNESASTVKKRQEIGRGMRICVDQGGERVYGFDVNTLTVIANESYHDFAKALQKEIETETGIKFGVVAKHDFAAIPVIGTKGEQSSLGVVESETIWSHLRGEGYLDANGKIQDALRADLKAGDAKLPDEWHEIEPLVLALLTKVAGSLHIRNRDDRRPITVNKHVLLSPEFELLWNRVKHRTSYRVDFDSEELIKRCIVDIGENLRVARPRYRLETGLLSTERSGIETELIQDRQASYGDDSHPLPDIVQILQDETMLTRETIVDILIRSRRLDAFRKNPQKFIEEVTRIIKSTMQQFLVDGISYHRIGDDEYFAQELFESEELFGYIEKNMVESVKSVYDHVVFDSDIESDFARRLELNPEVKLFAKLPAWFKIPTPLGTYNPDWAVLVERDDQQKLYFVVETKGSAVASELRPREAAKIRCGQKHFEALETGVRYELADTYEYFMDAIDG